MLAEMPAARLAEWLAFDREEPVSLGYRMEAAASMTGSVVASLVRDTKKHPEPFRWDEVWQIFGAYGGAPVEYVERKVEQKPPEPKQKTPGQLYADIRTWALLNQPPNSLKKRFDPGEHEDE